MVFLKRKTTRKAFIRGRQFRRRRFGRIYGRRIRARRNLRRFSRRVQRIARNIGEVKWMYIDGAKIFDASFDFLALPLAPGFAGWTAAGITQGTAKNGNRIGQLVRTKRISVQFNLEVGGAIPAGPGEIVYVKAALVEARGSQYGVSNPPIASSIWEYSGIGTGPFLSYYHSEDIKVHKQWKFNLHTKPAEDPTKSRNKFFEFSVPFISNWRWNDAGVFHGDNGILWFVMSVEVALVATTVNLTGRGRVSYVDY